MIKKPFLEVVVFLILLFSSSLIKADVIRLNKIIATVNGDVITQSELKKRMDMIRHVSENNAITTQSSALQKQALDSLIDSLLQIQYAQRIGMKINTTEVDSAISNIAKNNHLTIDQLKQSLQKHSGLSFKAYKEQIREQMLIEKLQQHILGKDITINEKDVEKILRNSSKTNTLTASYHVTDILFEISDDTSPDQLKNTEYLAMQMVIKLKQGADIDKLIQEYDAAGQHIVNNDLGWRKLDQFPALFTKEIQKMQTGQVVGPLKAANGLHIIKLLEIQNAQSQTNKLSKTEAQNFAFHQKLQEKLKPWLKELRNKSYIKIY